MKERLLHQKLDRIIFILQSNCHHFYESVESGKPYGTVKARCIKCDFRTVTNIPDPEKC